MKLKHSQLRAIEDAFDMKPGTVLNFSNRSFQEFFEDEFGIEIYDDRYASRGTSKANHFRAFLEVENEALVSKAINALWELRKSIPFYNGKDDTPSIERRLTKLLLEIRVGSAIISTDAIERFTPSETLDELVASIERDIGANKAVAAMDRLHTYCMKRFAHLLKIRHIECEPSEPLQSRVGKYVKALNAEHGLRDVTQQIIKTAIGIFDKFNHVRNNQSLAHDNELLSAAEAKFIFEVISAFLRFIKSIETENLDDIEI